MSITVKLDTGARDRLEKTRLCALALNTKCQKKLDAGTKQGLQVAMTRNVHSYQKLKTMEKILLSQNIILIL